MQKRTAGPYGQRTKINYRKSIAQYIVFVKNLEIIFLEHFMGKGRYIQNVIMQFGFALR